MMTNTLVGRLFRRLLQSLVLGLLFANPTVASEPSDGCSSSCASRWPNAVQT